MNNTRSKKRFLVTGCTGLVGHGICSYLLENGHFVFGTSRNELNSKHESFLSIKSDFNADALDAKIIEAISEVDAIVHCAAILPSKQKISDLEYYRTNSLSNALFIGHLEKINRRIPYLYISANWIEKKSILVDVPYVVPNPYIASKACGEIICQNKIEQTEIPICILRTVAPFGYLPRAVAVIPKFLNLVEKSEDIVLWGSGSREQVFTFVDDIANACEKAAQAQARGTFLICGPKTVTMNELAQTILKIYPNSKSKIVFNGKIDPQESRKVSLSFSPAKNAFGYEPKFSLEASLQKILNKEYLIFFEEMTKGGV